MIQYSTKIKLLLLLSREVEGKGPMKPGNLFIQGANSCRIIFYEIRKGLLNYTLLIEEFFLFRKFIIRYKK